MIVKNPIIKGFFPDPSICRANGKYYIACSSFQFFPGVPIFESEDMLNWKLIGHCLTNKSQVDLHKVNSSGGVFAPTLRYYDGTFYMVTNNNTFQKNFYVYTDDIYGEWSEAIFVDQGGIDPSLFFEDGHAYFTTNGNDENGDGCIMQCEIDIKTGEKIRPTTKIWGGAGGRYLESPHLYHIGDWYYIMVAEGGTEYGHMISYARSKDPFGPFENYPNNPVITNRNVGGNLNPIQGIGHGDLVQDDDGNTYMVCLGFRQIGEWQPYHHLGREVYICPISWTDDGWFTGGDERGTVTAQMEFPTLSGTQVRDGIYDVDIATCGEGDPRWCYMRDYDESNYSFDGDTVSLTGTTVTLEEEDIPTFLGLRQSEFKTVYEAELTSDLDEAGVTCYMDESQHYDLALLQDGDESRIVLKLKTGDACGIAGEYIFDAKTENVKLKITSDALKYYFYIVKDGRDVKIGEARTKYLSTEVAGGFTGVLLAMYAIDSQGRTARFKGLRWKQMDS